MTLTPVTGAVPGVRLAAVPALGLHGRRDPWLRMGPSGRHGLPAGRAARPWQDGIRAAPAGPHRGRPRPKAAIPACSSSSALAAVIIRTWITPRSRRSFSGSAGRARWRRPWRPMTATSGRFPARRAAAPEAEVPAARARQGGTWRLPRPEELPMAARGRQQSTPPGPAGPGGGREEPR